MIYRLAASGKGRTWISTAVDRSRPERVLPRGTPINTSARDVGRVATQAARRILTLVSLFFEAIVEARAMIAGRQTVLATRPSN
jgi:hypothetical protein